MKKRNLQNSIETAVEVVTNLKATEAKLQQKGQSNTEIKAIESSVRKIERVQKEILTLKEKLRNKKINLNQEKELMWAMVHAAKKAIKTKPEKKDKLEKTEKKK